MVSVGALDIPVTEVLDATADKATRKLSLDPFMVIPVPLNALLSVKTDLSVHTLPAFSVDSTSFPNNPFHPSIVDGSDTLVSVVSAATAVIFTFCIMDITITTANTKPIILFICNFPDIIITPPNIIMWKLTLLILQHTITHNTNRLFTLRTLYYSYSI